MAARRTSDFFLFIEAWISLAVARLMLVMLPFKRIMPLMQKKQLDRKAGIELLERIQLAIMRASKRSPWRTKCFEQALTAKMMLNRRGIPAKTYFGVKKEAPADKLEAHAWVTCEGKIMTGWQRVESYEVIAVF